MRDEESKDEKRRRGVRRNAAKAEMRLSPSRTTQTQSRLLFAHLLDLHQKNHKF